MEGGHGDGPDGRAVTKPRAESRAHGTGATQCAHAQNVWLSSGKGMHRNSSQALAPLVEFHGHGLTNTVVPAKKPVGELRVETLSWTRQARCVSRHPSPQSACGVPLILIDCTFFNPTRNRTKIPKQRPSCRASVRCNRRTEGRRAGASGVTAMTLVRCLAAVRWQFATDSPRDEACVP